MSGCRASSSPNAWATRAVCSSGVPSGILITTCNSLLLSNGSIFTCTSPSGTKRYRDQKQHQHTNEEQRAISAEIGSVAS